MLTNDRLFAVTQYWVYYIYEQTHYLDCKAWGLYILSKMTLSWKLERQIGVILKTFANREPNPKLLLGWGYHKKN